MMDRQRTVSKGERTVGALLNSILSEYKFKIIPAESKKLILQIEGMKKNTLTGSIKESETGEKLYGAVIIFKQPDGKIKYATSNSNGVFTTDLFSGTYSIEVRYMMVHLASSMIPATKTKLCFSSALIWKAISFKESVKPLPM